MHHEIGLHQLPGHQHAPYANDAEDASYPGRSRGGRERIGQTVLGKRKHDLFSSLNVITSLNFSLGRNFTGC